MDMLIESLGQLGTKQFLQDALPSIHARHTTLLGALAQRQWEQAANSAYLMKNTAVFYASEQLVSLLDNIIQQQINIIATPHFHAQLKHLLDEAETTINTYL